VPRVRRDVAPLDWIVFPISEVEALRLMPTLVWAVRADFFQVEPIWHLIVKRCVAFPHCIV